MQQSVEAGEHDEGEEVPGVVLVAGDESPVVAQPGERSLDFPPLLVPFQHAAVVR